MIFLEYLNNFGQKAFIYTGTGSVNVFGSAGTGVADSYGRMLVWFDQKEWVYDLEHNIWQIIGAYNTPDGVLWAAQGSGTEKLFTTEELLKFEQGPAVFDREYRLVIAYYENLLNQVNQKITSYSFGTIGDPMYGAPMLSTKNFNGPKAAPDINSIVQALDAVRKNIRKMSKNVHVHRTR